MFIPFMSFLFFLSLDKGIQHTIQTDMETKDHLADNLYPI